MWDLHHNVATFQVIPPQATLTATTNGAIIDTSGYEALEFVLNIGAIAAASNVNKFTVSVLEGDAANMSDGVDVTVGTVTGPYGPTLGGNILGTLPVINATSMANSVLRFGVITNTKRYVQLVLTAAGSPSAFIACVADLTYARHRPTVGS